MKTRLSMMTGFLLIGLFAAQLSLAAAAKSQAPLTYQVKQGDTLWSISRQYNVSVDELKRANGISDATQLKAGQVLTIPGGAYGYYDLLCQAKKGVALKGWKYIIIHHSATASGNARRFDFFHRKVRHMEHGLAYHFIIGNGRGLGDGTIEVGPRWLLQQPGGHVQSEQMNAVAIGICLVGNCDTAPPTEKQMRSLLGLIRYLQSKLRIPRRRVIGHREVKGSSTVCPGKMVSLRSIRSQILP